MGQTDICSAVILALSSICFLYPAMAETTEAPPDDGGGFFDDDNNKAMYLVLPALFLIYGGSCVVYCIHKCRRYCVNKKKRKMKAEKRRMKEQEKAAFSNTVINISDEKAPMTSGGPSSSRSSSEILTLETLDNDPDPDPRRGRSRSLKSQETDVDALDDVLQNETIHGVSPGYQEKRSMSQEMQHLDNQLKVAFRLAHNDDIKKEIEPDTYKGKGKSLKSSRASDNVQADGQMHEGKHQSKSKRSKHRVSDSNAVLIEDLKSIASVRATVSKETPKSMPDIFKRPDENTVALRKISLKDGKRIIFLSSQ